MRTLMKWLKDGARETLRVLGYDIVPLNSPLSRCHMEAALGALYRRGISVNTVIDIGASDGSWSSLLMRHYRDCQYLLIEAQPVHENALRSFCARHPNAQFVLAAAGEREGRIHFDARDPFGGQASYSQTGTGNIEVPVVTIDAEVASRALKPPYLLKLDTHGFEVPILAGAAKTLSEAEVVVVECYNYRIAPECLTFDEMCRYLGERGFRCIDLVDPLHRPYDDSFWQMDLVFVRKNRPEFEYRHYE